MTSAGNSPRPTSVRYFVLFLTTLVAVLLYLDRICLSFAERYVKEDLRLSDQEMALVLSSFFWAYALGQVPAGWLSDRFGARLMLSLFLALWSACTGLMGLAYGLGFLLVMRLGCGLFEAGAYPACAGLIRKWMPFNRRGLASGIVSIGGRLGGAAAPVVTAYLLLAFAPVSSPSQMTLADLLEPDLLIRRLEYPDGYVPTRNLAEATAAATGDAKASGQDFPRVAALKRIQAALPAETRAFFRSYLAFSESDQKIPDKDLLFIAAGLNEVLKLENLIDGLDLKKLGVVAEGIGLSEPASGRSLVEIERRNRLVLEATIPDGIRKIHGQGWRQALLIYGGIGLVVALIFWWFFRDSPRHHPACNAEEIALIEGADAPLSNVPAAPTPALPLGDLMRSGDLWLMSAVQFLTNFGWVFLITWLPRYLVEEHGVPVTTRGWMTFLPLFVGIAGMFLGGWLTDWAARRLGVRWGRSLPLAASRFVVMAAFLSCLAFSTPWPVVACLTVVAFATDLGTPSMWAYCLDKGGKNVGSVLGWGNMYGNIGAALSPLLLERIQAYAGWNALFLVCAGGFLLAGLLSLAINAAKPLGKA